MGQSAEDPLQRTTTMRFVVLALAALLAIGAESASLDVARENVKQRLTVVKASLDRILDNFDGTELAEYKAPIKAKLDAVQTYLQAAQESMAPRSDAMYTQVMESTKDFRETVSADMTAMQADLEPKVAALKDVLDQHLKEYMATVKDVLATHMNKQNALITEMQPQWDPVLTKVRGDIATNWEETKEKLRAINDKIAEYASKYAQMTHSMVAPYISEFRDQAVQGINKAREADTKAVEAKLRELFDAVQAMIQ